MELETQDLGAYMLELLRYHLFLGPWQNKEMCVCVCVPVHALTLIYTHIYKHFYI